MLQISKTSHRKKEQISQHQHQSRSNSSFPTANHPQPWSNPSAHLYPSQSSQSNQSPSCFIIATPSARISVTTSSVATVDVGASSCAELPTLSTRSTRSDIRSTTRAYNAPTALLYGAKRNELPRPSLDTMSSPPKTRRDTQSTPVQTSNSSVAEAITLDSDAVWKCRFIIKTIRSRPLRDKQAILLRTNRPQTNYSCTSPTWMPILKNHETIVRSYPLSGRLAASSSQVVTIEVKSNLMQNLSLLLEDRGLLRSARLLVI